MPDSRHIVFAHDGNLWIVGIDGGDRRRLTLAFGYSWFLSPTVSRDGGRIVASAHAITSHLWIAPIGLEARANAEAARQVTSGSNQYHPAWSPDGATIGYFSDASGGGERFLADVDYSSPAPVLARERQLTFGASAGPASWSPDGHRIVAHSFGGAGEVLVLDRDGGNLRRLGPEGATNGQPTWSPDGAAIIFRSNAGGRHRLWTAPAAGGAAVPFTEFDCSWPDGSPAAHAIACVAENPKRIVILDEQGQQASSLRDRRQPDPVSALDVSTLDQRRQVDWPYRAIASATRLTTYSSILA
jgi:dipeptidyl aminopeptidase/acylaminoacyl peptidase